MRKNIASQVISAQLVATADGSAVTTGTTTVYVTGDGGTQASGGGTVTHEGQGTWSYVPTQAETNYDHISFTFTNSSAIAVVVNVYTTEPQTGDSFARLGAPAAASIAADLVAIDNFVDELETRLTAARAGYLDNLNGHTAQTGDNFARLGAPAGASVSADVAAVKSDTGAISSGVTLDMSQALPGSPTADTVGDALKQSTYETAAKKNVALNDIPFKLVSSTDHVTPVTGVAGTITVQYAGDGATGWTAAANTPVEIGNGVYTYDAAQAEMNFDSVLFRFSAAGADAAEIAISTVQ